MDAVETVSFEILEDGGIFHHGDRYDEIVDEFEAAMDARDSGRLTDAKYVSTLKALVDRQPEFIDGHAHLGFALMDQGKPKLALQACLRGFEIGARVIPPEFSGVIEWGFLENRPFLRAAQGVVLCQLRLGQRREALALMEKMLRWNPNDNQGLRFIIGSEYLRAGDTAKAARIFETEAAQYPPYYYEAGLLHLMKGDRIAAATSLRQGFAANGYVAEMLCGNLDPMPLAIWHGSNLAEPDTARDYLDHHADLWRKMPEAIPFLHWLYTHPKVLAERSSVLECKEGLLWERDSDQRRKLLDQEEAALVAIDDQLSKEIIVERADRDGRMVAPWLYSQARHRFRL